MPAGRPTKYNSDILKKAQEYLALCVDSVERVVSQESEKYTMYKQKLVVNLPSIEGLAIHLGIVKDTIYQWEKEHPEFSDVINTLRAKQAVKLLNSGLSGEYNPYIAKALLSKHGYSEKQEVEQSGETSITVKWDKSLIPSSPTE